MDGMARLLFRLNIKVVVLLCCVLMTCELQAAQLSKETVKAIAMSYFVSTDSRIKPEETVELLSDTMRQNSIVFTAFNNGNKWIVVGNEDLFNPIICYGEGSLDLKLARSMQSPIYCLLQESLCNLDSIRNDYAVQQKRMMRRSSSDARIYIEPLLDKRGRNKWGQTCNNSGCLSSEISYNKFCPYYDENDPRVGPAGCTAVAMAQVMWYWQWPDHANIAESILPGGATYGSISAHYYDWENMPEELLNSTDLYEVDAVASLIRDCGYAGHMDYHADYASMTLTNAKYALDNNFKYHVGHIVQYSSGANAFLETIIDNL